MNRKILVIGFVAMVVAVVFGSLLPAGARLLPWYAPELTHVGVYALLTIVLALALHPARGAVTRAIAIAGGIGLAIELAQQFVPVRQFSVYDAMLNLIGAVLGGVAVKLVQAGLRFRSVGQKSSDTPEEICERHGPVSPGEPSALRSSPRLAADVKYLRAHRLLPAIDCLVERERVGERMRAMLAPLVAREREREVWRAAWEDAVFQAFEKAGIATICLKGAALARWLYDTPSDRSRTDLDLLVSPDDADEASRVLASAGYVPMPPTASTTQAEWRHPDPDPVRIIDLHWRLSDQPAFHHVLQFTELWAESRALNVGHERIRRLDAPMTLVHSLIHYYGSDPSHPRPDLWLLDIALVWDAMGEQQRSDFLEHCLRLGLSGLAALGLEAARDRFGLDIQADRIERLSALGRRQWRTGLADSARGKAGQLVLALRGQPGGRRKLGFVRDLLFPSPAYMRRKYPGMSKRVLPWMYVRRMLGR